MENAASTTGTTRSGRKIHPNPPYTPKPSKNTKQQSKSKPNSKTNAKSQEKAHDKTPPPPVEELIDEVNDHFHNNDSPYNTPESPEEEMSDDETSLTDADDLMIKINAIQKQLNDVMQHKQSHTKKSRPAPSQPAARMSRADHTSSTGSRKRGSSSNVRNQQPNKTSRLDLNKKKRKDKRDSSPEEASEGELSHVDDTSDDDSDFDDDDIPVSKFGSSTSTVSKKQHAKAVAGKFVEFSQLLPKFQHPDQHKYVLASNRRGGPARVMRSHRAITLNIEEYTEAFLIYLPLLLERETTAEGMLKMTQNLLTYLRNITNMQQMGYRWHAYDRHFRKRQEKYPHPWEIIDSNLEMQYRQAEPKKFFRGENQYNHSTQANQAYQYNAQKPQQQRFRSHIKTRDGNTIKAGTCASFNSRNTTCKLPCKYRHVCGKCEGNHPLYRHNEANPTKTN